MDEDLGREPLSMQSREEGLQLLGDRTALGARIGRTKPTRADPAILLMPDRSSFCCWVEPRSEGDRWMFLGPSGKAHIGPEYDREDSLDAIGAVLSRWRASSDALDHQSPESSPRVLKLL